MHPVKKIFVRNGETFTYVTAARSYIEWYEPRGVGVKERKRNYGRLGKIADLVERELAAVRLIDAVIAARSATVTDGCTISQCPLQRALDEHRPFLKLKTWQSQKTRLKFFRLWLGGRPVVPFTAADGNAFLSYLVTCGKQSATVDSYRNTLSGLYKKAGLSNPWRDTIAPSVQSRSLMYFNESQSRALGVAIRAHSAQLWLATQLLYYCFIRPGEMRLLTVDCFDLEIGTIEIPASISKNKKGSRVVIPAPLLDELRRHRWLRAAPGFYLLGKYGCPGEQPRGKNTLNLWHREVLRSVGIRGRFAFYSWKHTGVVRAVRAGINMKDLQMQLRHHSLDMVNEYLKNLGVLDSDDLRHRFPALSLELPQVAKTMLQTGPCDACAPGSIAFYNLRGQQKTFTPGASIL